MISPRRRHRDALVAVIVAILIGNAANAVRNVRAIEKANAEVARAREGLVALERLPARLRDVESSSRGFLLTGDPDELPACREAEGRLAAQLDGVSTTITPEPRQRERLVSLQRQVDVWLATRRRATALRQGGRVDDAVAIERDDAGKAVEETIRSLLGELEARERRLLLRREAVAASVLRRMVGSFSFATALAAFLLALNVYLNRRHDALVTADLLHKRKQRPTPRGLKDSPGPNR